MGKRIDAAIDRVVRAAKRVGSITHHPDALYARADLRIEIEKLRALTRPKRARPKRARPKRARPKRARPKRARPKRTALV